MPSPTSHIQCGHAVLLATGRNQAVRTAPLCTAMSTDPLLCTRTREDGEEAEVAVGRLKGEEWDAPFATRGLVRLLCPP